MLQKHRMFDGRLVGYIATVAGSGAEAQMPSLSGGPSSCSSPPLSLPDSHDDAKTGLVFEYNRQTSDYNVFVGGTEGFLYSVSESDITPISELFPGLCLKECRVIGFVPNGLVTTGYTAEFLRQRHDDLMRQMQTLEPEIRMIVSVLIQSHHSCLAQCSCAGLACRKLRGEVTACRATINCNPCVYSHDEQTLGRG